MWIHTWVGRGRWSERELHPHGNLNHLYGAFLLGFFWPIILFCLVLSPYLIHLRLWVHIWYISGSSHVCACTPLSQDRFLQRGLWVGWHHSPFNLQETFLCMVNREGLFDPKNWKYVVSIFYLGRAQPLLLSSCSFHLGVSVCRGQTPVLQPGACLSPASGQCVMQIHNAQCGDGEARGERLIFVFKFFLSYYKIWILFHK